MAAVSGLIALVAAPLVGADVAAAEPQSGAEDPDPVYEIEEIGRASCRERG